MYLKEILEGEVDKWMQPGSQIFIEAPTGCGKTSFILSEIREKAIEIGKPILYLCSRVALKEQIKAILNQKFLKIDGSCLEGVDCLDWFCVSTYQAVTKKIMCKEEKRGIFCENYSFVVCDEFHFIMDDVMFNSEVIYTCEYLRWLMKKTQSPRFLYLSATMTGAVEVFLRYLGKFSEDIEERKECGNYRFWRYGNIFSYKVTPQKRAYQLCFFDELQDIADLIVDSEYTEKWLLFVSNVNDFETKLAPELILRKVEYIFLDAKLMKSDLSVVKTIREKERFEEKVLVATKALDVGVNLKDEKLRNIVLMTYDETNFLQMLGRKRMIGGEKIRVFVKNRSGQFFRKVEAVNSEAIQRYSLSPQELWHKLVNEDATDAKLFLYVGADGYLYKNPLHIARLEQQRGFFNGLFEDAKAFGSVEEAFRQRVMKWLMVTEYSVVQKDYKRKQQAICNLRKSILKQYSGLLDAEQQNSLGNLIKSFIEQEAIKDSVYKKNRQMGKNQINHFFEQWDVGLVVISVRKKEEGVRTTFWEVKEDGSKDGIDAYPLRDIHGGMDVDKENL